MACFCTRSSLPFVFCLLECKPGDRGCLLCSYVSCSGSLFRWRVGYKNTKKGTKNNPHPITYVCIVHPMDVAGAQLPSPLITDYAGWGWLEFVSSNTWRVTSSTSLQKHLGNKNAFTYCLQDKWCIPCCSLAGYTCVVFCNSLYVRTFVS